MREMRTLYGTILAAAVAVAVVVQAEANDAVWTNKTANGAVSWNAAAALAFALTAQAEFKIDRSVMSEKYWALWNDEVQAMIDADIEANRKADGMFDLAAPDGGGVKGEPLVSGLFTRDMQKKPFLPESLENMLFYYIPRFVFHDHYSKN